MNIRQIQIVYDPVPDRIVLQVRTDQELVYGVWLTRRLVLPLVPAFNRSLQTLALERQAPGALASAEAREMLAQAAREQAARSADYQTPFDDRAARRPWGTERMLPAAAEVSGTAGGEAVLRLTDAAGGAFELKMGEDMAIGMLTLLEAALRESKWVSMPEPEPAPAGEEMAPRPH